MPEPRATVDISDSMVPGNPFPGLRPFNPKEHSLYFGRDKQTFELLRRLRTSRFLAIVGGSGSGKSSLVLAGLVPSLHGGFMARAGSRWRVAILRPGADPIGNLATALSDPEVLGEAGELTETADALIETTLRGSSLGLVECARVSDTTEEDNVLVVVDQFEELFRFRSAARSDAERDEAVAFVKLLLAAAEHEGRLYVVVTMRSDFIGDCMKFPGLPEAINDGQYLVPRMTRAELREVITGPVGVRGGRISPRLVARLLNVVGDNPDQLPVLQHALMRMWNHWEIAGRQGAIDLADFQAIGTMKHALSMHAEKAYHALPDERAREIAERLFKALTETEGERRGIRRPARLEEICAIAGAEEEVRRVVTVINQFRMVGRSFLMPPLGQPLSAETVIDLSHESLMRNWDRLVRWTEEEARAARLYRRLSEAARLHAAGEAGLWRSPELDLGLKWRKESHPTAAWARRYDPEFERAISFLEQSDRAHRESEERRRMWRRQKARRRAWLVGISALMLLTIGFSAFVIRESRRLRAVALALAVDDPLLKAQVLAEAPEGGEAGDIEFEAVRRVAYEPIPSAVFREPGRTGEAGSASSVSRRPALTRAALSPDGEWLATGASDGAARLWRSDGRGDPVDLRDEGGDTPNVGHKNKVTSVSFHPDGDRLLTSSDDGTAKVWSVNGSLLAELAGHRGAVGHASFSPRGDRIATASTDKTARIWDLEGNLMESLDHGGEVVVTAVFSPDGGRVATGSRAGTVRVWTLGDPLARIYRHDGPVTSAAFSPGGAKLATASMDGTARIWPLAGGEPVVVRHAGPVTSATFSLDGERVVTSSFDRTARVWSLAGAEQFVFEGHEDRVLRAVFGGPQGDLIVTSSEDGTARLWSLSTDAPRVLLGHVGAVNAAVFAAEGSRLATAGQDGTARVWPTERKEPRVLARHTNEITTAAFHPDGKVVVTASEDGTAVVWSVGGRHVSELSGHRGTVTSAAFHPEGELIVTSSSDKTARLWSGRGKEVGELHGHEDGVTRASFSFDGSQIVTSSSDRTARLWTLEGEELAVLPRYTDEKTGTELGHREALTGAAFNHRGDEIVTSSQDGTAWVWQRDAKGQWRTGVTSKLEEHEGPVLDAEFAPTGDAIVTASADFTAVVWRRDAVVGWRAARKLVGHRAEVRTARFGPEGDKVVSASGDGTVRVWSAETGGELFVLKVGVPVNDARFSPDGTHVLTALADYTALLWRVTEGDLRSYLEGATSSCLTVQQRCWFLSEFSFWARSRFRSCEREHRRTPPANPGSCL